MGECTHSVTLNNLYGIFKPNPSIIMHPVTKAHKFWQVNGAVQVPDGNVHFEAARFTIALVQSQGVQAIVLIAAVK